MITTRTDAGSYWRLAHPYPSATGSRPGEALPDDAGAATGQARQGIPISGLKKLDISGLKIMSIEDNPELRDRLATMWLDMQASQSRLATEVPDNAPQNTYATVTVNGKIVATLYNGGSVAMTNEAAGRVGSWQDPPGLLGPDLAQWRSELIARAVGGKIEKAPTAIRQSEWTPRQIASPQYTRAQLDAAFRTMMEKSREAAAPRWLAGYQTPQDVSGTHANVEA